MKIPRLPVTIIAAASLAAFLSSCGGAERAEAPPALTVSTMKVGDAPDAAAFSYAGTVEGRTRVTIGTKLMGTVSSVPFEEGAPVTAGQVVISIRSDDLRAKKAQVDAGRAEAAAAFANIAANHERIRGLYERKSATQKEMDDMQMAYEMAKAKLQSVEEMGKEVADLLRYADIASPVTGTVVGKYVDAGDLANPGMPLIEVEDTRELRVGFSVPESEIALVRKGDRVTVAVDAGGAGSGSGEFDGVIEKLNPSGDPASRQFRAQARIVAGNTGGLRPGMFASVTLRHDATPAAGAGAIALPESIIVRRGQLDGVFVLVPGDRALLRWIRTGRRLPGGRVEVLSGLARGEEVIVSSDPRLADGGRVGVHR